jgi:hypothetical protein
MVLLVAPVVAIAGAVVGAVPAVAAAPSNDNFASARSVSGLRGSVSGSLVGASLESGEPVHYSYWDVNPDRSVWYKWTAPERGVVEFEASATVC